MNRKLYILLLLALPMVANAQLDDYQPSRHAYDYTTEYSGNSETPDNDSANNCTFYFYGDTNPHHVIFKSVTEVFYRSDSNMNALSVISDGVSTFNAGGGLLTSAESDYGALLSRYECTYDARYRKTNEKQYGFGLKSGFRMLRQDDWEYDTKGNMTKHASLDNTPRYGQKNSVRSTEEDVYDSAGNVIKQKTKEKGKGDWGSSSDDVIHYKYDKQKRVIFSTNDYNGHREYWRYDDKGNKTFYANAYNGYYGGYYKDSTYTILDYFANGRVKTGNSYYNGNLTETFSRKYDPNGNYTEIYEKLSTTGTEGCSNNVVTVTVYDSAGNPLSEVENKLKDGRPFVTTTIHYYTFNGRRQVLCDSCVSSIKWYLYTTVSQKITKSVYDERGNELDHSEIGGGEYASDSRWTRTFNLQNSITNETVYSTCDATKPVSQYIYEYYPDGINVKQVTSINDDRKTILWLGPDGRKLKMFMKDYILGGQDYDAEGNAIDPSCNITVYTYQ